MSPFAPPRYLKSRVLPPPHVLPPRNLASFGWLLLSNSQSEDKKLTLVHDNCSPDVEVINLLTACIQTQSNVTSLQCSLIALPAPSLYVLILETVNIKQNSVMKSCKRYSLCYCSHAYIYNCHSEKIGQVDGSLI